MARLRMRRKRRGFTLMELLLVMAILVILGSLVGFYISGVQDRSFSDAARAQIDNFENSLALFKLDSHRFPSTDEGLAALVTSSGNASKKWKGPYIEGKEVPTDPWGNPYQYESTSDPQEPFRIWSWGPDMKDGTDDDVFNE
ncbi:MAG: general secretion pathway protein G [Pirellulaceae bacterium]|jgi:general secretion pathway protein G